MTAYVIKRDMTKALLRQQGAKVAPTSKKGPNALDKCFVRVIKSIQPMKSRKHISMNGHCYKKNHQFGQYICKTRPNKKTLCSRAPYSLPFICCLKKSDSGQKKKKKNGSRGSRFFEFYFEIKLFRD